MALSSLLRSSFCKVLLVFSLTPLLAQAGAPSGIPSKYDLLFLAYTEKYMPGVDHDLLKAQCWQESRFKERATSPVGAMGLCQFMPGTFKDVSKSLKFPVGANAYDPVLSVQSAAFYMAGLRKAWAAPRPEVDRYNLALASYNAGSGHLIKAQKLANGSPYYREIISNLYKVTGKHSKETSDYVIRIRAFHAKLKVEKGLPIPDAGL